MSDLAIVLGAVVMLVIVGAAFTLLLWFYDGLDAIRTATAITVATGGAVALLLAARRQRSTEETLEHQREVAQATERDAKEQRITELYTRAVDQLGAEKAPVRLGGLHALERLAQNNPVQRQTIVDVICSYLRMPYTPPDDHAPGQDAPEDAHSRQELQVRLTAQRILSAHLKPEDAAAVFWDDIDLNLTEAHLHQFGLVACRLRNAQFYGATFGGNAYFGVTTFDETADFAEAKFTGEAWFDGTTFDGDARFAEATFTENAWFADATFRYVDFDRARLASNVRSVVLPVGWTTRPAAEEEEEGWLYVVHVEDSSEQSIDAPGDEPA